MADAADAKATRRAKDPEKLESKTGTLAPHRLPSILLEGDEPPLTSFHEPEVSRHEMGFAAVPHSINPEPAVNSDAVESGKTVWQSNDASDAALPMPAADQAPPLPEVPVCIEPEAVADTCTLEAIPHYEGGSATEPPFGQMPQVSGTSIAIDTPNDAPTTTDPGDKPVFVTIPLDIELAAIQTEMEAAGLGDEALAYALAETQSQSSSGTGVVHALSSHCLPEVLPLHCPIFATSSTWPSTSPASAVPCEPALSSQLSEATASGAPKPFWFNVNAELVIYGGTEPDARVTIAGHPTILRPDGTFSLRFALPDGGFELTCVATAADSSEIRRARLHFNRATDYHVISSGEESGSTG